MPIFRTAFTLAILVLFTGEFLKAHEEVTYQFQQPQQQQTEQPSQLRVVSKVTYAPAPAPVIEPQKIVVVQTPIKKEAEQSFLKRLIAKLIPSRA